MPDNKKYIIEIDGIEGQSVKDANWWAEKKDSLYAKYPEARVFEVADYDENDSNENDQYLIGIPGMEGASVKDFAWLSEKKDSLYQKYPDAKVLRARQVDYWYDKAVADEKAIEKLQGEITDLRNNIGDPEHYQLVLGNPYDPELSPKEYAEFEKTLAGISDEDVAQMGNTNRENDQRLLQEKEQMLAQMQADYDANPRVVAFREYAAQVEQERYAQVRQEAAAAAKEYKDKVAKTSAEMYSPAHNNAKHAPGYATKEQTESWNKAVREASSAANDPKGKNLNAANAFFEAYDYLLENKRSVAQGAWYNIWESVGESEYNAVHDVLEKLEKKFNNLNAATAEQIDEALTREEKILLEAYFLCSEEEAKTSGAFQGGQIAGESILIAGEMLLWSAAVAATGGTAAPAAGASVTVSLGRGAMKITGSVLKAVGKWALKNTLKAAAFTAVAPTTYTHIARKRLQISESGKLMDETSDIAKYAAEEVIENFTEFSGEGILKAFGYAGDAIKGTKWGAKAVSAVGNSKFGKALSWLSNTEGMQFMSNLGFQGLPVEVLEELEGAVLNEITGLNSDALEQFFDADNAAAMLIGFAPMTLLGAGTSAASMGLAKHELNSTQRNLYSALSQNYTTEQIDNVVNAAMAANSPNEVVAALQPLAAGLAGGVATQEQLAALLDYGKAVASYKSMISVSEERDRSLIDAKYTEIEDNVGDFWVKMAEDIEGVRQVRVAQLNDGRTVFVTSAANEHGEFTIKDAATGQTGFAKESDIAEQQDEQGNTISLDNTMNIDDFLNAEVMSERQNAEVKRMTEERQAQIDAMKQRLAANKQINLGTEEAPQIVLAQSTNSNGVTVVDETGNSAMLTWEQVGNAIGTPLIERSDAQVVEQEIADLLARQAERKAAMAQKNVIAPAQADKAITEAEQSIEVANPMHIPTNPDGSVDENAFWNENPEGWAEWNDQQNNDGGVDSYEQITAAKAELTARLAEVRKLQATSNPANRRQAKAEAQQISARLAKIDALEKQYAEKLQTPGQKRAAVEQAIKDRVEQWKGLTGAKFIVVENASEVKDAQAAKAMAGGAHVMAWVNGNTAYVFLPNIDSVEMLDQKFTHEVVAHIGIKQLLGEEGYKSLCEKVWTVMSPTAQRYFLAYPAVKGNPILAADEYIAHIAEKVGSGVLTMEEQSVWQKIVQFVKEMLNKILGVYAQELTEQEILNNIRLSFSNLMEKGASQVATEETQLSAKQPSNAELALQDYAANMTTSEMTSAVSYELGAAQKAYEDLLNNPVAISEGEGLKEYAARKAQYQEDLRRAKEEYELRKEMLDFLNSKQETKADNGVISGNIYGAEGATLAAAVNQKNNVFGQGVPGLDAVLTANYFYLYENAKNAGYAYSNGEINVTFGIPIKGNEEYINLITEQLENGTFENNESADLSIEEIVSRKRQSTGNRADVAAQRGGYERNDSSLGNGAVDGVSDDGTSIADSQLNAGESARRPASIDADSNVQAEGNTLFSIGGNSLIGLHNLTEEKLRKAIKQGGLANPSTAVVNIAEYSLDGFGEISLLMPSSLVDASTGDNVGTYTGDAWTPTYPHIIRQVDDKGWKIIKSKISAAVGEESALYSDIVYGVQNFLEDNRRSRMEYVFLKEKGVNIPLQYKGADGYIGTMSLAAILGINDINAGLEAYEQYKNARPMDKRAFNMWLDAGGNMAEYRKLKDMLKKEPKIAEVLKLNEDVSFADFDSFAYQMYKRQTDAGKVDTDNTIYKAAQYVDSNGLRAEFDQWVENLVEQAGAEEVFFAGYTRSGDRIYKKNTLENVSRHMRQQGRVNAYDNGGLSATKSVLLERLTSLIQIRKNKSRLKGEAEYNKAYDVLRERLFNIISSLASMQEISSNQFMNIDYAESRLQEAMTKRNPIAYLNSEYGYEIASDGEFANELKSFMKDVKKMPAKYFETKFERPVYLNEFAAAVMPSTTKEEVKQAVAEAGLPIFEYDMSVEGARKEATLKATENGDIRFSLIGEKGASNLDKAQKATVRLDNLAVAREMEAAGKDAKAIKVATGWERGVDKLWRYEVEEDYNISGLEQRLQQDLDSGRAKAWGIIYSNDLGNIIEAYPDFNVDIMVWVGDEFNNTGEYQPATEGDEESFGRSASIEVRAKTVADIKDVLTHEIQHVIQEKEGFAQGGSTYGLRDRLRRSLDEVIQKLKALREQGRNEEADALAKENRGLAEAVINKENDVYGNYRKLAGEVEARNASARMAMPMVERLSTLAVETEDVAREDQIILMEALAGYASNLENKSISLQNNENNEQNEQETIGPDTNVGWEANGSGVAGNTAGIVERTRDRSDIRVFEQGLESSRSAHSDDSERARRDAESERLVDIAKKNNLYIPLKDTDSLGEKVQKRTGESVVYIDEETGRVFKVKDPYAKSAMKAGVEPEDAIYEHIVHNLVFPEAPYQFVGISDKLGDVRIVLSQDRVESVQKPTKAQIAEALASKGLLPENAYSFGNDLISVTDVEGDNVLLGEDGTVYFIDPIIRFKKPVQEVIETLSAEEGVRFSARTDEQRAALFDNAKQHYGLTNNFNAAGYMLPDGSLLDFSEANDGGDPNSRSLDHRDIEGIIMDEGKEYDSRWMYIADFMNEGAIRLLPEHAGINIMQAPTAEQRKRLFDFIYKYNGEVILEIADERLNNIAYVEYDRRTSPARVLRDIDGYFNEGIIPQQDTRFSASNQNQEIFVSNAAKAVEGIKMAKATPEQWLNMLEKNGGLKAAEDKWMGLSDWLKASDKKTLTKEEVLQFINENKIQIEEVHYAGEAEDDAASRHDLLEQRVNEKYKEILNGLQDIEDYDKRRLKAYYQLQDELGEFAELVALERYGVYLTFPYEDLGDYKEMADAFGVNVNLMNPINETRLAYTTDGLENNHEIALTIPTIESWNKSDDVHFGDAGEGRAIAWVRFGDTYLPIEQDYVAEYEAAAANYRNLRKSLSDKYNGAALADVMTTEEKKALYEAFEKMSQANGNVLNPPMSDTKVLVIDEIQSKRHQEGREKGYATMTQEEYTAQMNEKYGTQYFGWQDKATPEEWETYRSLAKAIPAAPFEKNWAELAMKRMLRYAAENGYDYIAWTKGDQQVERYNLGGEVKNIFLHYTEGGLKHFVITLSGPMQIMFGVNKSGIIERASGSHIAATAGGGYIGNALSDVVGQEMSSKILSMSDGDNLSGEGLKIGGEGMRGFYDKMLPAFMNKYGKKWGVKVEDIDLPNLEGGLTMHSVPVTAEMKSSVMEGQTMFSAIAPHQSSIDEVDQMFADWNRDPFVRDLYAKVSELAHKMNLKIKFVEPWSEAGGANILDKVKYNVDYFNSNDYAQNKAGVLLHELIHSVTVYAVAAKNSSFLTQEMKDAVKQMEAIYDEIKDDPAFEGTYGAESVKEMVSELSNPRFRQKLRAKNLFQRIIDAIKQLLGIDKGTNALDNLEGTLEYMIENFDQNAFDAVLKANEQSDYYTQFSAVTDPAKIAELESGEKIKVYRAMQVIDGKLYPPMSAKVDGKMREPIELGQWEQAEERPDLVDAKGNFKLDKANKSSVPARYNPYIHTSASPLNDQFSSAQSRPNLVTVEVEIPASELTSGYKAEGAKDAVGQMEWKAGVVQSKLSGTRTVILSRWDKPIRIVPDSEVAAEIVKMFDGKNITMPSNVVTPSLRAELEKLGVPFVETDNQGRPKAVTLFSALPTKNDFEVERKAMLGITMMHGFVPFDEMGNTFRTLINEREAMVQRLASKANKTAYDNERLARLEQDLEAAYRQLEWWENVQADLVPTEEVQPEVSKDMEPQSFEEYLSQLFTMSKTKTETKTIVDEAGNKKTIRLGGKKNGVMLTPETLTSEMGWKSGDWAGIRYIVSAKDGMSLDAIAEMIAEDEDAKQFLGNMDTMDIKNAVMNFLQSVGTYAEIRDYVKHQREAAAQSEAQYINGRIQQRVERVEAETGMSVDEFNARIIEDAFKSAEENLNMLETLEIYGNFEELTEEEYERYIEAVIRSEQGRVYEGNEDFEGEQSGHVLPANEWSSENDEERIDDDIQRGDSSSEGDRGGEAGGVGQPSIGHSKPGVVSDRLETEGLSVEEIVETGKQKVAAENADAADVFMQKLRKINEKLSGLRSALAAQREYDQNTVKILTSLANDLLEGGKLTDMTRGEIKRLLSVIKDATGKSDLSVSVDRLMDIMIANQLRFAKNRFADLLKIKASKVNASGVEAQGKLDVQGQQIMQSLKDAMKASEEVLNDWIAEAENDLDSDSDAVRHNAELKLAGYELARQYKEDIEASETEEAALREDLKKTEHEGKLTKEQLKEYRKTIYDAVRENKMARVNSYEAMLESLSSMLAGSVARAVAFREAETQRVENIHHMANSDMQGMPADEHNKKDSWFWNSSLVRFLFKPLATFDQMLRAFAPKSRSGEGYLWNHFMGGWLKATENEYKGIQDAHERLDAYARYFFDVQRWSDLFALERKLPKAEVTWWNAGKMETFEVSQGNLLYIYMINKMADGRMKLRKMGITEDDVDNIIRSIDPRFLDLADWIQERFLPSLREKYNDVHERLFGAPMAAIDNYFPIRVLANARAREVDLGVDESNAKPSTITGNIIKRTKNSLALDILGSDAFDVVLGHIEEMEKWAAFAEWNKDLNTLLSYKKFRNRVQNMAGIYGAGNVVWNNFRSAAEIAAGVYKPATKNDSVDKAIMNIAKGVTGAKISFRVYTAFKQLLSWPAFLSDARTDILAKNMANPFGAWKWSMENLPLFEKRWKSRQAGDSRLMETESDWKIWKSKAVEIAGRLGMTPNAFVDAVTVAIGARSIYETRLKKYLDYGYSQEVAEEKAKRDATVLFNESQQSNESAFLSQIQVDRTVASVVFTVFRNSSMGYQRMYVDAIRNIGRMMKPGYKGESVEYMTKQMVRDGLTPEQAERAANRIYNRSFAKNAMQALTFGFIVQLAWNLGPYLPYIFGGDDDEKKEEMVKDAIVRALVGGPVEGLASGNIISNAGGNLAMGESLSKVSGAQLPLASDIENTFRLFGNDNVRAYNDLFNLAVQSFVGVNPQTISDIVVAVVDACNGDLETSTEAMLCMMRILQVPQSQIENFYIDEIDFKADEAYDMTVQEFAERYAKYKVMRNAPITQWMYTDEEEKEKEDKYIKTFTQKAKEERKKRGSEEAKAWYQYVESDEYKSTEDAWKEYYKALEEAKKGKISEREAEEAAARVENLPEKEQTIRDLMKAIKKVDTKIKEYDMAMGEEEKKDAKKERDELWNELMDMFNAPELKRSAVE